MITLKNMLICLIGIISTISRAQPTSRNMIPEWSEPVNLGNIINSISNEVFPMLSPDGLSLYFASNRPGAQAATGATGFEGLDIYVSQRESIGAPWGTPQRLDAPINTHFADHSTAFSTDGHWMYFASSRPGGYGKHDLYRSYRPDTNDELGWEKPQNLGHAVNSKADDSCPFLVMDNQNGLTLLYFVSKRKGGPGSWDVYVSRLNRVMNKFGQAVLVGGINSPAFDGHFDAEHGMLWSGNKKGYGGGDLWFTQKDKKARWTTPINIGPPINTNHNEGCFTMSNDGSTLLFTSDRPDGTGGYDLYISKKIEVSN